MDWLGMKCYEEGEKAVNSDDKDWGKGSETEF